MLFILHAVSSLPSSFHFNPISLKLCINCSSYPTLVFNPTCWAFSITFVFKLDSITAILSFSNWIQSRSSFFLFLLTLCFVVMKYHLSMYFIGGLVTLFVTVVKSSMWSLSPSSSCIVVPMMSCVTVDGAACSLSVLISYMEASLLLYIPSIDLSVSVLSCDELLEHDASTILWQIDTHMYGTRAPNRTTHLIFKLY